MTITKWANGVNGAWATAADWLGGIVPGSTTAANSDIATIDAAGAYTVSVDGYYIGNVLLNGAGAVLSVGSGGLRVKDTLTLSAGTLTLQGTLKGGTLRFNGGVFSGFGTLDGVRVQGPAALSGAVTFLNGPSFVGADGTSPGSVTLGYSTTFGDAETLANVALYAPVSGSASLNLGANVTLDRTGSLNVLGSLALSGKGNFVNAGAIAVSGTLTVGAQVALTEGAVPGKLTVGSTGRLIYQGLAGVPLSLAGLAGAQIAGTLEVSAPTTTAVLAAGLASAASIANVALTGTLDNSGAQLEIKAGTPLANVTLGGTVLGGTLKLSSGKLHINDTSYVSSGNSTLDGVKVLGTVVVESSYGSGAGLSLKDGVTFAGLSGTGRGGLVVNGNEVRLLDSETLDHVDINFGNNTNYYNRSNALTIAAATNSALGTDATLNVLGTAAIAIGGGGTFSYAGAISVQSSAALTVAAGVTLAKLAGGSLTVASGGSLTVDQANLGALAGATLNGSLIIQGGLTGAAYAAATATLTGTGTAGISGLLDNTGNTLVLQGTGPGAHLSVASGGTLRGGVVALGSNGSLSGAGTLDGVTLRGPVTLASGSLGLLNGLTLQGAGGTGRGALTLTSETVTAQDSETLDNATVTLANSTLGAASGSRLSLGAGVALDVTGASTLNNVSNAGAITVEGNSSLTVDGSFVDTGPLALKFGGKLLLSGTVTTAALGGLIGSATGAGTIGLANSATLDNTGATLTLTAATRLNTLALPNATIKGGTIVNAGGQLGVASTVTLDGVTWLGSFAPTAADARYLFRNGTTVQAAGGGRALIDLTTGRGSLSVSAALDNTDLRMSGGSLSASNGTNDYYGNAAVVLNANATLTVDGSANSVGTYNSGFSTTGLTTAGTVLLQQEAASLGALTNTGAFTVKAGSATAATLINTGTITLDGGALVIGTPTMIGGTIRFNDPTSKLVFNGAGAVGGTLQDFQNGDSIDIQGLAYDPSLSVDLQGSTLQVNQGSTLVGSFQLQGGGLLPYSTDQFSLLKDGSGGTLLRSFHRLSNPVFSGPGTDFDAAFYLAKNPDVAAAGVDPLQHYLAAGYKEGRDPNAWFSNSYYYNQNPDIKAAGLNPLLHFEQGGWKEGRDPGPNFSVSAYLGANPDVKAAGIDPLQHFLVYGRAEGRYASPAVPHAVGAQDPLVDRAWYLAQHPDVAASGEDASANYHRVGWMLGYNPDQFFDTKYYLATNPDIAAARVDPLAHFEASGFREGREPSLAFSDARYLAAYPDVAAAGADPLQHFLSYGRFEGRMTFINGPQATGTPDPLVDRGFYYGQFASIVPASADAAASYNQTGWRAGLNPDALFDTNYYLSHNPDIRAAGVNPLTHYEQSGWKEGRDPSAAFSTNKYLGAYADVRPANVDPLTSYVTNGMAQGRTAFAV